MEDDYYIESEDNIKWVRTKPDKKIIGCWYEKTYCDLFDIQQNPYLHERYHFRIKDDAKDRK